MLVLLIITEFILIGMIKSALSVKTCYFCADLTSKCNENFASLTPYKMRCNNFLVNKEIPMKFVRHPAMLRYATEIALFSSGLAKQNVKTRCIDIKFKYGSFFNQTSLMEKWDINMTENYTFRSCVYKDVAKYKDACENFADKFGLNFSYVSDFECRLCKKLYCNHSEPKVSSHLTIVLVVLGIVSQKWLQTNHNHPPNQTKK